MDYTTKDGAHFTRWWHPIGYALMCVMFWPLFLMDAVRPKSPKEGVGAPAVGILIVFLGWAIAMTTIAGIISIIALITKPN
jgi:hypothetical protein